jgi:hypothetical protein
METYAAFAVSFLVSLPIHAGGSLAGNDSIDASSTTSSDSSWSCEFGLGWSLNLSDLA